MPPAESLKLPARDLGWMWKLCLSVLTRRAQHQAMLAAIITLALLSLLVATEGDSSPTPAEPAPDKPMRPATKPCPASQPAAKTSRAAA